MAEAGPRFLSDSEWETLGRPGRCIARAVQESRPDGSGRPQQLATALSGEIGRLTKTDSYGGFVGLGVAVRERDGRSWAAESAARLTAEKFGHFELICLAGRSLASDSLPLVTPVVGRRRLLKSVLKHDLSGGFPALRPAVRVALMVAAVLAVLLSGFATQWLDLVVARGPGSARLVVLVALALAAAAAPLANFLLEKVSTRAGRDAVKGLRDELEDAAGRGDRRFANLVTDLAKQLGRGRFPRVVLIDDYERLDLVSRRVLEHYVDAVAPPRTGVELWVAFERTNGERLSLRTVRRGPDFQGFRHYRLAPLTPDERARLATLVGHPERAQYTTVGSITDPAADQRGGYLELLKNHLLNHPRSEDRYGDLDLLFLLSLNAEAGYGKLERDFIVGQFGRETGLPSELLARCLKGTRLGKGEFRKVLSDLIDGLGATALLEVEQADGVTRISVHREAEIGFQAAQGELGALPARGLGHLFWSIFWFDKLRNHAVEAFWLRKLSHHLLRADPEAIREGELYRRVLERQLEALLHTLQGSLATCLYGDLPALIERAVDAVLDLEAEPGVRRRLRAICWDVYALTGSDVAMGAFLRLRPPSVEGRRSAARPELAGLFVDSQELSEEARSGLSQALARLDPGSEREQKVPVYVELRAATLTYALRKAVTAGAGELAAEAAASAEALRSNATALVARLDASGAAKVAAVTMIDLLSLSLLLWRLPELVREEAGSRTVRLLKQLLEADGDTAGRVLGPDSRDRSGASAVELLLGAVETSVLFADELQSDLRVEAGADLLRLALARELVGVAMGALAAAAHALGGGAADRSLLERVEGALRLATDRAGERSVRLESLDDLRSPAFVDRADKLLQQSAFVWWQFELPLLERVAQARRAELLALATAPPEELWNRSAPLRDALHAESAGGWATVTAWLALAALFHESAELRADHFLEATQMVLEGRFGDRLKEELAMQAVGLGHHLGVDLGPVIAYLVMARDAAGETPLARRLAGVEDAELEGLALRLLNASRKDPGDEAGKALRGVLRTSLVGERPPEVTGPVENLLDMFDFRERWQAGELGDPETVIEAWSGRRDSWTYAAVLSEMVTPGRTAEVVVEESLDTLRRSTPSHTYSSYLSLALALTRDLHLKGRRLGLDELPASFVVLALPRWEAQSRAESNAEAFRLLDRLSDGDRPDFRRKAEHWGIVKLQHDEATKLVPMLRDSRFGAIFLYYFDLLASWQLEVDDPDELMAVLRSDPEERRERLVRWRAEGAVLPPPFKTLPHGGRIATAAFAALGKLLFAPPGAADPAYEEARRHFTELARDATSELLRAAAGVRELPRGIRDLVQGYARRFEEFTQAGQLGG